MAKGVGEQAHIFAMRYFRHGNLVGSIHQTVGVLHTLDTWQSLGLGEFEEAHRAPGRTHSTDQPRESFPVRQGPEALEVSLRLEFRDALGVCSLAARRSWSNDRASAVDRDQ